MRILLTVTVILFFLSHAYSQKTGTIKGIAFDTLAKQPIANATVTLMQKKDSSLVSFTLADNAGRFELNGVANGEYRLLLTHVNYRNGIQYFTVDDQHKDIQLGNVIMNDKNQMLSEVILNSEGPPVTLVGDTIQYNAGSFKTQPNASVEDLLKKLPGVKVEKDGTVKAQGEKVQKVLVDGKEFFGNDPKIATKNLPADAIDKVQVYDKLSDQAQMTGFDDGNSEKTINLKLKNDKKKGKFGKVSVGAGTEGRYQGKFNVSSFKGARQMSAIGMGNNSNAEGFSFMDVLNFTGAMNQLKNGGGNISIQISDSDPIAGLLGGNNSGINTTFGGGLNYNNLIGSKIDFQSNYFFSRYNPNRQTKLERQFFSPANLYRQNSYSDNLNNNHRFNFSADYQIDSFSSIKISPSFSYQKTKNRNFSDYSTVSEQGLRINDGNNNNLTTSEGYSLSTNILYRKKFRRKGRTFSLNLLTNLNNSDGDGRLQSLTNFYDQAGLPLRTDQINQTNNSDNNLKGFNVRAVYTEPLFKHSLLEFSAGRSFTKSEANKTTYDYNVNNGKFDLLNNLLSNNYENTYDYTNAGIRLRKQTKKYSYALGATLQKAGLKGKVITEAGLKDSVISKDFTNVLPNARLQYNFTRFKNLSINYTTSTNQPSASQLQPIPDNSNPLYVKMGNPNLKQEFTNAIQMNLMLVNPFKNRNFFAFLNFRQTQNKIVNYDRINSLGVDSVLPVNVNGVYDMNGSFSLSLPVHALKGNIEFSSNIGKYHGKQFVNGQSNIINTNTLGPNVRLSSTPTTNLSVSFTAGVSYSKSTYSLASARTSKYLTQDYVTEVDWQLPKGFFFATDFNYRINNQLSDGFNAKVPLLNASISKQVLHFNRGELKLSVNDLLNKNIGITRSANQNYIEDSRVNTLRRFFLLAFTYNLSKTGLSNNNSGGMKIITR